MKCSTNHELSATWPTPKLSSIHLPKWDINNIGHISLGPLYQTLQYTVLRYAHDGFNRGICGPEVPVMPKPGFNKFEVFNRGTPIYFEELYYLGEI